MGRLLDASIPKFILVGVLNTLVSAVIMFGLYNLGGCGYWLSTAISYLVGCIVSFFLNKSFTFKNKGGYLSTGLRFVINAVICYVLAFSIAQPLTEKLIDLVLYSTSVALQDNVAMLCGMVIYTCLNYFGQRFFVFRDKKKVG